MSASRIQTVCTSLNPKTTLHDAEVVAGRLRAEGFTVTVGQPFTVQGGGRKGGLAAVNLTIAETPPSVPEPEPEPVPVEEPPEEPKQKRGNPNLGRIKWEKAHPGEDYDAWVAAGKPGAQKRREKVVAA